MLRISLAIAPAIVLAACTAMSPIGQTPAFTPVSQGAEHAAMMQPATAGARGARASLWTGDPGSLLGDRRAMQRGDILTVVVEIDDRAELSNTTDRSRQSDQQMSIGSLFGLPQRVGVLMPDGASLDPAVSIGATGSDAGAGSIRRNEKLTLRVAATVVSVLPNGLFEILGTQQVMVNFEMRELVVTGFVRPEDISRQNEITYDKIASARIAYGGAGQITDMQQPRVGTQILDHLLPF